MTKSSKTNATSTKNRVVASLTSDLDEPLSPDAEEYSTLCKLAHDIQQERPWDFLQECGLFGVEDPETGELGFVSVMGAAGEYYAVAIYRGVEGLYGWREFDEVLRKDEQSDEARTLFRMLPQLLLSFDHPDLLEEHDHQVLRHGGLKFVNDKPLFRSQRPAYYPWFLTRAEARHMIHVLPQTIEVAKQRASSQDIIPNNCNPDDTDYLVRVPSVYEGKTQWANSIQSIQRPPTQLVPFGVDRSLLDQLRTMPTSDPEEIDLFALPAKVGEPGERDRVLFGFLITNSLTGYILEFAAFEARDGVDLMYAEVAERVAETWLKSGVVPAEVRVRSKKVRDVLRDLVDDLGINLSMTKELPSIDEAKTFIHGKL